MISFLIYPYWNINEYLNNSSDDFYDVSNLSILEYKLLKPIGIFKIFLCF